MMAYKIHIWKNIKNKKITLGMIEKYKLQSMWSYTWF